MNRTRRVIIAGGGVGAVEAALTLRELAGDRVDVTLLAPDRRFGLPPETVAEAAGGPPAVTFDLPAIASDLDVELVMDALDGVRAGERVITTRDGRELGYDALLLALGALPGAALPGALRFAGRRDVAAVRAALDEACGRSCPTIAFVATGGIGWTLPLYEFALLVGARLDADGRPRRLSVVTAEAAPLSLFGAAASREVARRMAAARIETRTDTLAESVGDGRLWLAAGGSLPADLAIALPELIGPDVPGLTADGRGFVPVDRYGRVAATESVWAVGDMTARPLKQGGLAAQQAEVAATSIAAWAGAAVEPEPYEPVLRGMLLTGDVPRFLRRSAGSRVPSAASDRPLWSPAVKLVGRRLGPYLASHPDLRLDAEHLAG